MSAARARLPLRARMLVLALAVLTTGCEILTHPDADGDGVVGPGDVDLVEACLHTAVEPFTPCAAADVDRNGRIGPGDLARVTAQLGQRVCNGTAELCQRRYDQVTYPTTHNAFAAIFDGFGAVSNHFYGIPVQLEAGVRGFMLDSYELEGEAFLCHASCAVRAKPLAEGLTEIRSFLDEHPGEVVTLIFEAYASSAATAQAFATSGLDAYLHRHAPGAPWPTLAEMIDAGERVVVLTDRRLEAGLDAEQRAALAWYHYLWDDLAVETPFSVAQAAAFGCSFLRGRPGNDLLIFNHFITQAGASTRASLEVNQPAFIARRALRCWSEPGFARLPSFLTVDFWSLGDLFRAADLLNGWWIHSDGSFPDL
jgi:hypothetical protein